MTKRRSSDRSRWSAAGWLPVWFVLWLVLVPSLDRWEVVVGLPVAAVASLALVAAGGGRWVGRGTVPALVRAFPGLVADVLRDTVRLGVVLARTIRTGRVPQSQIRREPLPSSRTGSDVRAVRAAAIVRTALTPARVPIHVDGDELLFHEIEPAGPRQ